MPKHKKKQEPAPSSNTLSGPSPNSYLWPVLAGLILLVTLAIWLTLHRSSPQPAGALPASITPAPLTVSPDQLSLVDEGQCQTCHAKQFQQWQGSHHQLAMQEANDSTVLGDFDEARFKSDKEVTRFFRKGDEFWVNTPGFDGQAADFKVAYAIGIEPLQQYLIETVGGHLQALGVAWDTQKSGWFHLYPGQGVDFKDPLHWSKPQQNANFMCIECHTTGFKRNFDAPSNTYSSHWQALGVGCQSCHGPASGHLQWSKQPGNLAGVGFPMSVKNGISRTEVETCGRCHSRRAPLGDGFRSHMRLMDDYLPSALTPVLYEIDGKIKDEVFEYGSFVQSKMYTKGVACSDCHNPHSTKLRITGNGVCLQCHNPGGSAGRPGIDGKGLLAKDYDSPEHHKHQVGSAAAQCSSCHMPGKFYMVNDYRHDHSFSIPDPDRALKLGVTDACLGCHQKTDEEKVIAQFRQWFGTKNVERAGYADSLWLARNAKSGAAQSLLQQLTRLDLPAIRRATLLAELPSYPSQAALEMAINNLKNADPQVREAATRTLTQLVPPRVDQLGPLLDDPVLAVRTAAAYALLGLPAEQLGIFQAGWSKAIDEYEQIQLSLVDRAEANLNLAMLYQATGRSALVEPYLRKALQRDADFLPALITLTQWLEDNFRTDEARDLLGVALHAHPQSALLRHAQGLALVREGKRGQALQKLRDAVRLEPENSQYRYVLAIALYDTGQQESALKELDTLLVRQPSHRVARLTLTNYLRQAGKNKEAQEVISVLRSLNPMDPFVQ